MSDQNRVKVWDIAVRVFHWSLVLFFVVSYLTGEEDDDLHIIAGYVVLGLVLFRLLWGLIGTRYARFWNFIYSPRTTIAYARSIMAGKPKHYLGHNPLGGWMVVFLLVSLSFTVWSGLELYAVEEGKGPLANSLQLVSPAYADDDDRDERKKHSASEEFWEEVHEVFANLTVLLVFLHIAGVIFSSIVHRENLVRGMITGYKRKRTLE
jgi:cytochrome b